ncbi:MAG: YbaB/EbfC family nucleoid-associated protein [Planctomycetota bacterium]|jgi:DNA-binding YbaB/EbfC family protein|nr:YbaB/EbfC family nucleoid-associated protein [Planctomycetota bacterium]
MTEMAGLLDMLKLARRMLDNAKPFRAALARRTVEGRAGAGLVTARMNGNGELLGLEFAASVMNSGDRDMLADLIIAAVNDARKRSEALKIEAIKEMTGGIDLSAFGIDPAGWI